MKNLKGFLIDLDGVLYIETKVIFGAPQAVNWLRQNGFPFRFVTNTTIRSRKSLHKKLQNFGIAANESEIFSTCVVAARWLRQKGIDKIYALVPEDARRDFSEFEQTTESPQAVVIGDLNKEFTFSDLDQAFRCIKNGARLLGLQKNRFWQTLDGLAMDVGAYVAALEYAAETEATIIGKPNRAYFEMAVEDLQLPPEHVAMIGDDIHSDIVGACAAGLKTILVHTGKSQFDDLNNAEVKPDWEVGSIADLPKFLSGEHPTPNFQ